MKSRKLTMAILLIPAVAYAHGGHGGGGCGGGGGYHSSGGGGHSSGGGGGFHSSGSSHISSGSSHSSGISSGGTHVATSAGPHPHGGGSTGATSAPAHVTHGGADVGHGDAIGTGHDAGKTEHGTTSSTLGDHGHPVARTQHRHHRRRGHVDIDGNFVVEDVIVDDCGAVVVPDDAPADQTTPDPASAPAADEPPADVPPADDPPADDTAIVDDGCTTDPPVAVAVADQAPDEEPVPPEAYDVNGAPSCLDDSTVVGYRRCTPFARWDVGRRPSLEVESDTTVRSLDDRLTTIRLGSSSLVGGARGRDVAVTQSVRLAIDLGEHAYLGLQGEAGGLASQASPMSTGDITPTTGVVVGGDVFGGIRGRSGRWRFASELGAGGHMIAYTADSASMGAHGTDAEGERVLELRVRSQYWFHPFFAISASAGANMAVPGEWSVGLGLVTSTRAFGGN